VKELFEELKRRNVFRVAVAWLALGWLVIQVTSLAVPALNLPEVLNGIVFYIGIIGLPFALLLAWAYELTPSGVQKTRNVEEPNEMKAATGRKIERGALLLAVLALMVVVADSYLLTEAEELPVASSELTTVSIDNSIAVLPFVNMSDDKDYFADGLSEELLNLLAKTPDLQVAARTSSFAFKGKNGSVAEIGKSLNVAYVLEGSVRRSGDKVRITAQLIRVENGFHMWSDTFDRELKDIFAVQDEIAAAITGQMQVKLGLVSAEKNRPTVNVEAYALYLEALPMTSSADLYLEAEQKLLRATTLDPSFTQAWLELARVQGSMISTGLRVSKVALELARLYVDKALELEPDNKKAQSLMRLWRGENSGIGSEIEELEKMVREFPQDVGIRGHYGWVLTLSGRYRDALDNHNESLILDPNYFSPWINYATALRGLGRYDEAELLLAKWGDRTSGPKSRLFSAAMWLQMGEKEKALKSINDFAELSGVDEGGVKALLFSIVDPKSRGQAIQSPAFQALTAAESTDLGLAMMFISVGDGERFWPIYDRLAKTGNGEGLINFMAGYHRFHDFLDDDRMKKYFNENGYTQYWQKTGPPEWCENSPELWMCILD
jgi:TolB-like protein